MRTFVIIAFVCILTSFAKAGDEPVTYSVADRERLVRLETRQDEFAKQIDKRLEQIQKQMESLDSRLNMLTIVFLSGVIGIVGFVLWDRRSMVKPVIEDQRSLSEREAKLENIIREYAKEEPRLAKILQDYIL